MDAVYALMGFAIGVGLSKLRKWINKKHVQKKNKNEA